MNVQRDTLSQARPCLILFKLRFVSENHTSRGRVRLDQRLHGTEISEESIRGIKLVGGSGQRNVCQTRGSVKLKIGRNDR